MQNQLNNNNQNNICVKTKINLFLINKNGIKEITLLQDEIHYNYNMAYNNPMMMNNNPMMMPNQPMMMANNPMMMNNNPMMMNNNPMMMQMNMNVQMSEINNSESEDFYDYIKEIKKKIVFLRVLDDNSFNLLIPCSLRKNELYSTANFYKKFECSEMQLFHNEKFLNDDESSIDCIKEGDQIKIIELMQGVDFSSYESYLSKHRNETLFNIILFIVWKEKRRTFQFAINASIEEIIKIFFNELRIPEIKKCEYYFLFNGYKLNINDKSTLVQKNIKDGMIIEIHKAINWGFRFGKNLEALIKEGNKVIGKMPAGTLQTIKNLYLDIDNNFFNCNNLSLKKIKINGKEIQKDDERTLSSIGIRDNFICYIELNKEH